MLEKSHWLAITITENGKHYSYVWKVPGSNNLWAFLKDIPNISSANICDTKKAAKELVTFWNDSYRQNGTCLYDTPAF